MNLEGSFGDLATITRGGILVTPLQVDVKRILLGGEIILIHNHICKKIREMVKPIKGEEL